jgi:excisionase family DNA binding protein
MEALLKKTTQEDQRIALGSIQGFKTASKRIRTTKKKGVGVKIKIQETGEFITVPKKAITLLAAILEHMAEGKSISIISSESEVSTQQAADMLNVSRPHLVKLLEQGKIPHRKVGKHRRILLQDLITYEKNLEKEREKQLEFLAKQAQGLNLGYE